VWGGVGWGGGAAQALFGGHAGVGVGALTWKGAHVLLPAAAVFRGNLAAALNDNAD
jgi:hypothetical protein